MTVQRTRGRVESPYAAVPLVFGVQQLIEGGLWLGLPADAPTTHVLAIGYLLFSNVLWPVLVPVAVWLIEPGAARRRAMLLPLAAGGAIGLFFVVAMITHPVSALIKGAHIAYNLPHPCHAIGFAFYAFATCIAPLLSSHRTVRLFGVAIIVSMIGAYLIYAMWFASVWCFFAALTSCVVFLHFPARAEERAA